MPGGPLTYEDIYKLAEELQAFSGAQIQAVYGLGEARYALEMRLPGQSRWILFDLTPARPFIVSTDSTRLKARRDKRPTPVLNFLKAHFVNLRLDSLEVAQKPNRTLLFKFGDGEKSSSLVFKCFPHGQHLLLQSEGKLVNFPLRPKPESEEPVAFVEPEPAAGWSFNEEIASVFLGVSKNQGGAKPQDWSYHDKLIAKLEKAVSALEEGARASVSGDEARIAELQKAADSAAGNQLQSLFDEIKKIRRKKLLLATRRNELEAQIEKLKAEKASGVAVAPKVTPPGRRAKGEEPFSGTRVRMDAPWELWVGRTDWQNDDLVRLAGPHELWIHLRDYPGAHGVIRGPKKSEPSPAQIEFACRVVAVLSQKKKNSFSDGEKLDFIVTPRKFVKKPKGAPAGRVIVERESIRRIAFKSLKFEVI